MGDSMATATLSTGVWPMVRELVSLTKPRVSLLVLLTSAGGLALAEGALPSGRVLAMLLGMWLVVGCANALNCWMERESDGLMSRTSKRALPAGRLSPQAALWFALVVLGAVPGALPPMMGVTAASGELNSLAWVLFGIL